MKKLLIIDSNSILNRAFYGIRLLSTSDGNPTNAIYGFLNILIKLISEHNPDYLCMAFDVKAPTFRHKQFSDYKAQRKPMPEGLAVQMPIAREIVRALGVPVLELEGYEADDIIGTVSAFCERENVECMIATGDKDDLQLATDKTKVILTVTKQGINETVIYDDKAVFEKYGVTPLEFIDVKALMGDASDNIPGVPGIGEKTALKLIQENHSIENIYQNPDEAGVKGAMLEKLKKGRESAFMSKHLATIIKDVPIDFTFEDCKFDGGFSDESGELFEILTKLELNSIIKRLGLVSKTNEYHKDWFADFEICDDISMFYNSVELSCYFEFSDEELCGFSVSDGKKSFGAKISASCNVSELEAMVIPIIENENIKKLVYNVKEAYVYFNKKAKFKGITADIAIAAYLVNPAKSEYSIESVVNENMGIVLDTDNSVAQLSLLDDTENDTTLARKAFIIKPLWEKLYEKMKSYGQEKLYFDVELPLVRVLADMQINGFCVDREELKKFGEDLKISIDKLTEGIYKEAGEEFNINSTKQLGIILFEKLGLKALKKTKTGYSTNIEVLEKLKGEHPIIDMLIEYRHISKLKSTYCDGMISLIDDNGRIHSVFNQTVTLTGRISSTEPNLQNIPARTPLGRELRKMFVAPDEEHILIDADYSQIELRVLAHIANDKVMKNAFLNDEDIHTVTASQVFDTPLFMVTPDQRSSAKAVNFGIVYGIGEYSLAQDLKIPVKRAKEYISNYLEKYIGVRDYMDRIKQQAKSDGYVKTLMNRIRFIPELRSSNYNVRQFGERVALNTPIQGTAADIIKCAMVRVVDKMKQENLESKLILQVHDELIIEAKKSEADIVQKILKEEMENAMKLSVPLIVDMKCGRRWYDAK